MERKNASILSIVSKADSITDYCQMKPRLQYFAKRAMPHHNMVSNGKPRSFYFATSQTRSFEMGEKFFLKIKRHGLT